MDHAGARGLISLYFELISPAMPPSSACLDDLNGDPKLVFPLMDHLGGRSMVAL